MTGEILYNNHMLADKIFRNALIISLLFHLLFFYRGGPTRHMKILKVPEEIEVTYLQARDHPLLSELIDVKERLGKAQLAKVQVPAAAEVASIQKQGPAKPSFDMKSDTSKPVFENMTPQDKDMLQHISPDAEMLISDRDRDLSSDPTYLNYYNAIRGRIYRAANADKPYYFMSGQVRLLFSVSRAGELTEVAVAEEASTTNPVLRTHAVNSVRKAAPFPPFLKSMNESSLTLRLNISFEQ